MRQIVKSLLSFCLSICKHSYSRNFDLILMKFCTVIRGPKSMIDIPVLKKIALWPVASLKRYNSVSVKDHCMLFAPTSLCLGLGYPVSPVPIPVAMGQKLTTTPFLWNIIACCLHLPPIFGPRLFDSVIKIFPLPTPDVMATNFGTKLTITCLSQKIIARCFHLPPISGPGYAMVSCKFLLWRPVVMATNRFYSNTKLAAGSQEHQTLKAAARLYSVAMGQIPHFTERIFHSKNETVVRLCYSHITHCYCRL